MLPTREKALQKLAKLNTELEALFQDLASYTHAQLNYSPAPEVWSAQQTMHHMILSERYSLLYCKKKLSFKPNLQRAGIGSALRTRFIGAYLSSPLKWQAPQAINTSNLPQEDTLDNIKQTWLKVREELATFFQEVPDEYWDKDVYKHPFGGRISLSGMLDFFRAHFRRHRKQVYRTLT